MPLRRYNAVINEITGYEPHPRFANCDVPMSQGRGSRKFRLLADAKEWVAEHEAGRPNLERLMAADEHHQIERVGRELRAMMPWIDGQGAPQVARREGLQDYPRGLRRAGRGRWVPGWRAPAEEAGCSRWHPSMTRHADGEACSERDRSLRR